MDRRAFIGTLAGSLLAAPLAAEAQQLDHMRRLGLLLPYIESDAQAHARVKAFKMALEERGWIDGRNVRFEFRYTDGQPDRLPALAADLAQRNVDIILTAGTEATEPPPRANQTNPLVQTPVRRPNP